MKLGYFFFPTLGSSVCDFCVFFLQLITQCHEVHITLWQLALALGQDVRYISQGSGYSFSSHYLGSFLCPPWHPQESWLKLHCSALLQACLTSVHNVQNWWLSFLVLHTVLVTDSRGRTTCSAKKPAGLQTADTWPGQSPKCVLQTWFIERKHIQIHLEEMGLNMQLLINGLSCKGLNLFLVNVGLLGKSINGSPSRAADAFRGEATDYVKGAEALWDSGHRDCEMKVPALMAPEVEGSISLADHIKSVASVNSLQFPQTLTMQKYSMIFTPFSVLDILGLLPIVLCRTCKTKCVSWAGSFELLSSVSVPDVMNG